MYTVILYVRTILYTRMHQKHTDDNDERGYRGDGDQRHDQDHEVDDDNTTDDNTINVQNHLGIHG